MRNCFSKESEIFLKNGGKEAKSLPRQKKNWDKEWEIPEDEQGKTYDDGNLFDPDTDDPPPVKKLKRDMEREALTRLEEAARTEADFREVVKNWDRLDDNRERRERYHEILRGNKTPPLEHNMIPDGYAFPASLNGVLARQNRKGDFLDTIYYCVYDLHELVPQESGFLRSVVQETVRCSQKG